MTHELDKKTGLKYLSFYDINPKLLSSVLKNLLEKKFEEKMPGITNCVDISVHYHESNNDFLIGLSSKDARGNLIIEDINESPEGFFTNLDKSDGQYKNLLSPQYQNENNSEEDFAKNKKCACCDEILNQDGDCSNNNCTEDKNYGVAVGAHQYDEYDNLKKSIIEGKCQVCGKLMEQNLCPNECYEAEMLEGIEKWLKDNKI